MLIFTLTTGCNPSQSEPDASGPALSADGSSDESVSEPKVKLTFWDENPGPVQTPVFEKLLDDFMKEHPNIEVEYVGIPWESAKEKFDVAIASDATPDVASMTPDWLKDFTNKGALMPLDDFIADWDEKDQMNENLDNINRQIVGDGKLYCTTYTTNVTTLWCRDDIFQEKGIDPPSTWDEFFEVAEKATDVDNGSYGFSIRGGPGGISQLEEGMIAYSGIPGFFDENGKCLVNDPLNVEFVTKLSSLYRKYTPESDITSGYKEIVSNFDSGVAAMIFHNLGSYGEHSAALPPEAFSAMQCPDSVQGYPSTLAGMHTVYGIFNNTEHPSEAWELLSFLSGREAISYWNENMGQIPTRKDNVEDEWLKSSPHISAAFEYINNPELHSVLRPLDIPNYSNINNNIMLPKWQEVLAGSLSPQDFLDQWAQLLTDAKAAVQAAA